MNIKMVTANSSHASTISSIGRQAFRAAFSHLFNDNEELREYLDYTYHPDKIAKSIEKENNIFFIAFVEDVPVGFAKVKKYSLNEQIESIAQMELQKIYVLPYYHGSGAGAALILEILELANELRPDFIWLDTYVNNVKAIHFYEKFGFKKTGTHYFMIGTQTFEYFLMSLPVAVMESCCTD